MSYVVWFLVILVSIIVITSKFYFRISTRWCQSKIYLKGKTVIITGGNSGIGYATALDFAYRGARIILACVDMEEAQKAQKKLIDKSRNPNIICKYIDLASFDSVKKFVDEILKTETKIDILVNNAACIEEYKICDNGIAMTMKVNYFSIFLLTNLLLENSLLSENGRIVNVASFTATYYGNLCLKHLTDYEGKLRTYFKSKLCLILFTRELSLRLQNTNMKIFSVDPGPVTTHLWRCVVPIMKHKWVSCLQKIVIPSKTCAEGAQSSIYASIEDNPGPSGSHINNCQIVKLLQNFEESDTFEKLWKETEKIIEECINKTK